MMVIKTTGNDGYLFLFFASMLNLVTLGNDENVTNWISTSISSEKIKPFDTNLELTMPNLSNGRVR